ncbi:MAG: DUF1800 domain-containing protein [Candidatus Binatia bacterium]
MIALNRRFAFAVLAGPLSIAASVGVALAAPQSTDQQRCLNHLTKAGADVVRQQGKSNWKCLHYATHGQTDKLGDPGDTLTPQACLTNDVGGKVAKKQQRTIDRDTVHCQAADAPDFGSAGATAINAAAQDAALQIAAAIFGADLGAAVVDGDVDSDGAQCQEEILKGANRIVDDMWRVTRGGVKDGLKGHNRRAGAAPDLPAHSSDNLQGEMLAQSLEDLRGKIQAEVQRLDSKAQSRCVAATTPIAQMFPGQCSAAATIATLVDCVEGIARGHFYQSVEGIQAMSVECDLTDNGAHDESCVSPAQQRHLLDRLAYGPDPYTIGRIQALGLNGYIDEQLNPGAIDDSAVEATLASTYPSLELSVVEVRDCYPNNGAGTCPGHEGGNKGDVWKQMEESEIYRAAASHRQLEAVLVDFWFNHYNVAGSAGQQKWNTPSYLRDSIRPWILGNFTTSVVQMARGSAMLDYLDQRQNQVGVPPGTGYNENFPRELLELHTMGVTAPYTESDVKEVARALTGWRNEWNNELLFAPGYPGFRYQNSWHDFLGPKTVLGQIINLPGDGEQEGFDAIELAATHPSSASFLCTKLVRRFVDEAPPFVLVERCVATFIAAQGDGDQLAQVTETILTSKEFQLFPEYRKSKVKRPVVLLPSLLRAVGADPDPAVTDYQDVRLLLTALGERIRNADPPTGYPDDSVVWASPGAIVQRFNLVEATAQAEAASWGVSGAQPNADIVDDVITVLFPLGGVSPATRSAAIDYLNSIGATDAQQVEQAGAFLLSSPEFLTH